MEKDTPFEAHRLLALTEDEISVDALVMRYFLDEEGDVTVEFATVHRNYVEYEYHEGAWFEDESDRRYEHVCRGPRERAKLVRRKKARWHEREVRKDDRRIARSRRGNGEGGPSGPAKKPWQTGGHDARRKERLRHDVDADDLFLLVKSAEDELVSWRSQNEEAEEWIDAVWREAMTPCAANDRVEEPLNWHAASGPSGWDIHFAWVEENFTLFFPNELPTPEDILRRFYGEESPARNAFRDGLVYLAYATDPTGCFDKALRHGYRIEEIAASIGGPAWYNQELGYAEAQAMRDLGASSSKDEDGPDLATDYFWRRACGLIPRYEDPERKGRFLDPVETWNRFMDAVDESPEPTPTRDDAAAILDELLTALDPEDDEEPWHEFGGPEDSERDDPPSSRTEVDEEPLEVEPEISAEELEDIVDPLFAEPGIRAKAGDNHRSGAPRQLKRVSAGVRSPGDRRVSPATHVPSLR